jgi:MurNAc alpha-1-phosphate uridylyltransferase
MVVNAMILAAGRGQRMRPLTDVTPKPLLKVGKKALIEYHLRSLSRAGVDRVVINVSWQGAQIREFLGSGSKYGLSITYSDEGPEALETGGGVHRALPELGTEPFWLVNGDVYTEFAYPHRALAAGILAHLILVPNPVHNPNGDFCLVGGQVKTGSTQRSTYSGIALLHPQLFAGAKPGKFPLAPLLVAAMDSGLITGELFPGRWIDVGTPARLQALDRDMSGH